MPMLILLLGLAAAGLQDSAAAAGADIVPRVWLVLPPIDERGRRPFRPDAVFRRHLLDATAAAPVAGEELAGSLGAASWREVSAADDGSVLERAGWGMTTIEVETGGVWLAELSGAAELFVNGDGFGGDLYRYGHGGVPISLRAGPNLLYVSGVRGAFRLRLQRPQHRLEFAEWGARRPDLVAGEEIGGEVAVMILNASEERVERPSVVAGGGDGPFARVHAVLETGLVPLQVARVPVPLRARLAPPLPEESAPQELEFSIGGHPGEAPHLHRLALEMRRPDEARRRTYRSRVDGAVVDYSELPPSGPGATGLVLSLHGAGVESRGQAGSYAPKPDWWLVAPSNRAPFGFDWQDWGRIDALEVMERAQAEHCLDPRRTVVTGHSMGGHGTWSLAVNDPDRFAALAPSAGWSSFDSYGSRPAGALRALWHGADGSSDTLGLLENLRGKPIYILHGDADDNVPASEAGLMAQALDAHGIEYRMHLEPGAGHWWTDERYPGAECMDWPPIFESFADARLPELPRELDFTTADPGIDADHSWLRVEQPLVYGAKARVRASWSPADGLVHLETDNVRRLRIAIPHDAAVVDGQEIAPGTGATAIGYLRDGAGRWRAVRGALDPAEKRPERCGPFKRAFDRRFVLVYGTQGTPAENHESLARARFDAAIWSYRALGDAQLVADHEVLDPEPPEAFAGRNLILYGNADSNGAWTTVLPADCPLQARRGELRLGAQRWTGPDRAAVFCYPRADDPDALAGVFADTGAAGSRLGYTLAAFVSGVGYPDYAVFDASVLELGDGGVLAAGWWDWRWGLAGAAGPRR